MDNAPRYPVYVVSKGRAVNGLTWKFLDADGVPYRVVVEPQEAEAYSRVVGEPRLLVLPFSNLGLGSTPARNWVWDHSMSSGHSRHWVLDDNIREVYRRIRCKRIRCRSGVALRVTEDFVDRYENVAIAGLNYKTWAFHQGHGKGGLPPFYLNVHVYSCMLINNALPFRWRGRYNEDTDLCLKSLSSGWCTLLMNAFLVDKMRTLTMRGGNTDQLYAGDGRLRMAKELERLWPGVVKVTRKYGRAQHLVFDHWSRFNTPLRLRDSARVAPECDERGMRVVRVASEIKSKAIRSLTEQSGGNQEAQ